MSRNRYRYGHGHHHRASNKPMIVVHDHDVLSGRGVNIAHHPGNERFRTLVTTRADESYCATYSASEKRAVAEDIIKHIKALDPPGRFLKRDGRGQVSRGLGGPWDVLTDREAVKKTCQALRDCNRQDRQGYAVGVAVPTDVVKAAENLANTGLSTRDLAAKAAAAAATKAAAEATLTLKRTRGDVEFYPPLSSISVLSSTAQHSQQQQCPSPSGTATTAAETTPGRSISPSVENAAEWLKRQKTEETTTTHGSTSSSSVQRQHASAAASTAPGTSLTAAPTPLYPQPQQVQVEILGTPAPPPTLHRTAVTAAPEPAPIVSTGAPCAPVAATTVTHNGGWTTNGTTNTNTTHRQPLSDNSDDAAVAFPPIDFAPAPAPTSTTGNGGPIASAPSPPSLGGGTGGAPPPTLAPVNVAQQQQQHHYHHHPSYHNNNGPTESASAPVPLLPAAQAPSQPANIMPNHYYQPQQQPHYNHSSYPSNGTAAAAGTAAPMTTPTTATTSAAPSSYNHHYSSHQANPSPSSSSLFQQNYHHHHPNQHHHHHPSTVTVEPMPLHTSTATTTPMDGGAPGPASYHMETLAGQPLPAQATGIQQHSHHHHHHTYHSVHHHPTAVVTEPPQLNIGEL